MLTFLLWLLIFVLCWPLALLALLLYPLVWLLLLPFRLLGIDSEIGAAAKLGSGKPRIGLINDPGNGERPVVIGEAEH